MTRTDFNLELVPTLHGVEYYIDSDGGALCLVVMGTWFQLGFVSHIVISACNGIFAGIIVLDLWREAF